MANMLELTHISHRKIRYIVRPVPCVLQGVANRDLKLENLLLDRDGSDGTRPLLKICDFGYSKVRRRLQPSPTLCSIVGLIQHSHGITFESLRRNRHGTVINACRPLCSSATTF